MTPFSYFFWVEDGIFSIGLRRYNRNAAFIEDVCAQAIGIVSFICQNEAAVNKALQCVYGAETIVLVSTNQVERNRKSDKIHRHRKLGVASPFRLPKLLFISWKRMLGRILVRFDVSRVEHHRDQQLVILSGDLLDRPLPQARTAPAAKTTPHAVPFPKTIRHLVPHRSSAGYPPDAIEYAVKVGIRATATAAYLFPVSVFNFFSSSRIREGISSDLNFDTSH